MNSIIKVSVVIVTYNCNDVIKQCIESLNNHNSLEIIVIDNSSTDGTQTILKSINTNFNLIQNTENTGFTRACNQGIKSAKGKYILLFNPDAYVTPSAIDILSNKLDGDETIGAVSPKLLYPDGALQNYNRRFPTISGVLVESFVPMKYWSKFKAYNRYTYSDLDLTLEQELEQPAGAAILFRNRFLLDENYFIYGSDVELCKNIVDAGYKIVLLPKAEVFHHQSKGGTGSTNAPLKAKLQLDFYFAMRHFFAKHYGVFYALSYFILNLLFLKITFIVSLASFNSSTIRIKWKRLIAFLLNKNFKTASL